MSLILEALRKSEAARRRGQVPDVLAAMPQLLPAQARPVPVWLWLLAGSVALLVILALAWQLLAPAPSPPPPAVDATSVPIETATAPTRTASKPATLKPIASTRPPALPQVERLVRAPPAAAPAVQTPVATTAKRQGEKPVLRPVASTPNSEPTLMPAPQPLRPAVAVVSPPDMPTPAPAIATPAAPPMLPRDDIESVSDLAPAERRALPPLRLSMHMWNSERDRRFVILDGNRLGEGDRSGDLVISAITNDGVILDWHGRRLKLPMR